MGCNRKGELVYANYGDEADFVKLEELGVNIKGKILLMRYAHSSRGTKVQRAQQRGAIGCILYSDPQNYAPSNKLYPSGMELPETGLQIGTIMPRKGDARSRGFPSKDGLWRVPELKYLPKIASQPIPVKYARRLLKFLCKYG